MPLVFVQAFKNKIVNLIHTWGSASSVTSDWRDIVSSADGQKLMAISTAGIYISHDAGVNWSRRDIARDWRGCAMNGDGTIQFAVSIGDNGGVFRSTDSGLTWTATSLGTGNWYGIAVSYDGTKVMAIAPNAAGAYLSTDGGTTWVNKPGVQIFSGFVPTLLRASDDFSVLMAIDTSNKRIIRSTNMGTSWSFVGPSTYNVVSCAMSADGTTIYVGTAGTAGQNGVGNTRALKSTDGGSTWSELTNSPSVVWYDISCSRDGSLVAGGTNTSTGSNGKVYVSYDGGNTWPTPTSPTRGWDYLCVLGNGPKIAATVDGGAIYVASA